MGNVNEGMGKKTSTNMAASYDVTPKIDLIDGSQMKRHGTVRN